MYFFIENLYKMCLKKVLKKRNFNGNNFFLEILYVQTICKTVTYYLKKRISHF